MCQLCANLSGQEFAGIAENVAASSAASSASAQIAQIYVGYFNRAPDPSGLSYWTGLLQAGTSLAAIAESFSRQPEALTNYSFLSNPASGGAEGFVNEVYTNLFNRAADAAGLAYWKGELAAGKPVGRTIVDIISGAQGTDKTVVDNKVSAALSYVDRLGDVAGESFRAGDARRVISDVDASPVSVTKAEQSLQNLGIGNGLTLTILDSSGALAPFEAAIRNSVAAAWDMWAVHFKHTAPIEVEITYQRSSTNVLAFAGSAIEVTTGEIFNGRRVSQSGVGAELITGIDPNGTNADARITLAADLTRLVFRDSPDDLLPPDKLDALSIFAHEFGHVLGFRSALDSSGRPTNANFITNYDKYVSGLSANSLKFFGPNAINANGGAPALANSGPAHLGVGGDLMASSIGVGQIKTVGVLDVAVLQDLGLPVSLDGFRGFA